MNRRNQIILILGIMSIALLSVSCSHKKTAETPADIRTYWLDEMIRISDPVIRNTAEGTLKQNMPYQSVDSLGKRRAFSYLEAFGRTICGFSAWLEAEGETDSRQEEYRTLTRKALANAVNPESPDYMAYSGGNQPLVDAAYLAEGIHRAKHQLWDLLPETDKSNLVKALTDVRTIRPGENNWLLFASMVEATLLELTGECDMERLEYGVSRFMNDFYKGDGMYGDGEWFHMDYYNSYVIHPMLLDVMEILASKGLGNEEWHSLEKARHTRYSAILERLIAPDGTYPVLGRSISACRFGAFHSLAQDVLLGSLPDEVSPGQARSAMTAVLKKQMSNPENFDTDGWMTVGFMSGRQEAMSESYVNTGSLYHCLTFFLPLGLPADDPFWTSASEPWTSVKAWSGDPILGDHAIKDRM